MKSHLNHIPLCLKRITIKADADKVVIVPADDGDEDGDDVVVEAIDGEAVAEGEKSAAKQVRRRKRGKKGKSRKQDGDNVMGLDSSVIVQVQNILYCFVFLNKVQNIYFNDCSFIL